MKNLINDELQLDSSGESNYSDDSDKEIHRDVIMN